MKELTQKKREKIEEEICNISYKIEELKRKEKKLYQVLEDNSLNITKE